MLADGDNGGLGDNGSLTQYMKRCEVARDAT